LHGTNVGTEISWKGQNATSNETRFARDMVELIANGPEVDGIKKVGEIELPTRKKQEGN
jgi:hypothetical protein